ncbi:MAG: redoxin domain-containing protein, partial [Acidobacteriota bacterium]
PGPLVAYRDRSATEIRDISVIRATADGWCAPVPVHADGWRVPGCPVNGPAVAAGAGDPSRVAVAWFTAAHNEPAVNIAFSTDSGEHFGPPVRVDDGRPIGRVSVRIDTGGDAIVAWIEATPDGPAPGAALRARRVQAAPGAEPTAGPAVEIAQVSPSRASGFPRLALEADRLIAAWTDVIRDTTGRSGRDVTRIAFSTLPLDDLHGPGPETSPAARHAVDEGPAENGAAGPGPWSGSPDSPAPRYVATTLDGEQLALADLRGQPVLVNVWATWCAPCREEMGDLASLHERFAPGGLAIVGINVDVASNRKRVDEFLARERTPYRILLDPDDRASRIFGLRSLPASFLFDAKGRLIWRRIGVIHAGETELNEILTRVTARDRSS